MALKARDFNVRLLGSSRVRLASDPEERDAYGRLLAYVFLERGEMVNLLLLRKGLAHVLFGSPPCKYRDSLLAAQREAMKEKVGIWSRPSIESEETYMGNRRSWRFHRPSCPFGRKISAENRVVFQSRFEAFWQGYSPCKRCKP
jgi:endonuclease YncB( thermonuclease family)